MKKKLEWDAKKAILSCLDTYGQMSLQWLTYITGEDEDVLDQPLKELEVDKKIKSKQVIKDTRVFKLYRLVKSRKRK